MLEPQRATDVAAPVIQVERVVHELTVAAFDLDTLTTLLTTGEAERAMLSADLRVLHVSWRGATSHPVYPDYPEAAAVAIGGRPPQLLHRRNSLPWTLMRACGRRGWTTSGFPGWGIPDAY